MDPIEVSPRSLLTEYGHLMYARGLMKGKKQTDLLMPLSNRLRMAVEAHLPTTAEWYKEKDDARVASFPPESNDDLTLKNKLYGGSE